LAAISYYFTGNAGEATTITVLFNAGGTLAYYGLEKLWASLDWERSASRSARARPSALSPEIGLAAGSEDSKVTAVSNVLENKAS